MLESKSQIVEGAFDSTVTDIKLNLDVNYDLICKQIALNKETVEQSKKAKLILSFHN